MPRHLTTDDLVVQGEGVDLGEASAWDFVGESVTFTDDEPGDTTVVTMSASAGMSLITTKWIKYFKDDWVGTSAAVDLDLGAMTSEGDSSFIGGATSLATGLIEVLDDGLYVINFQASGFAALSTSPDFPPVFTLRIPAPYGGFDINTLKGMGERLRGDAVPANGLVSASIQATVPLAAGDVLEFSGYADPPNETFDLTTYIARIA